MKKIAVVSGACEMTGGVLSSISEDFAEALTESGEEVEYEFLMGYEDALRLCKNKELDAIVTFQSGFFSMSVDGQAADALLGDITDVPKFNIMFDSPALYRSCLMNKLQNVTYLYHDEYYVDFIKKNYAGIRVKLFPLAGSMGTNALRHYDNNKFNGDFFPDRKFDVSFVGRYNDYREILQNLNVGDEAVMNLALDYFDFLLSHAQLDAGASIFEMIADKGLDLSQSEVLYLFELFYPVVTAVDSYRRELVIKKLIDAGIEIDVFSSSWQKAPYADGRRIHIHPGVSYRGGLNVMSKSLMSLNVFSGHKGGMTERIANSMLNGAVCVTDSSSYISKNFRNGENIVVFDLNYLDDMVNRVYGLLDDRTKAEAIALEGFYNAMNKHSWSVRIKEFCDLINK